MNTAIPLQPERAPLDRLGFAFCLAALIHGAFIFGVAPAPRDAATPRYETMEVVLVQRPDETLSETARLAQANQRGGGEVPLDTAPALPQPDAAPQTEAPALPQPDAAPQTEAPALPETPPPAPRLPQIQTIVDAMPFPAESLKPLSIEAPATEAVEVAPVAKTPEPSATALLTEGLRMVAENAKTQRQPETNLAGPRRKFISASSREYKYAAYMEAWRAKVERVGNLNYPEEAKQRGISGNLVLDVALTPDGNIHQITVRRSSGRKILDEAAIRIVELAAPYAPFPPSIRADTDLLHITRTWQFLHNREFK